MEELKALNKKRGIVKSKLTSFGKYVSGVDAKVVEKSLEREVLIELECRMEKGLDLLREFEEIQGDIETLTDDSDLAKQLEAREIFQNEYFRVLSTAKRIIADCEHSEINSEANGEAQASNLNLYRPFSQGVYAQNSVKLPQINIPTFNGSFDKWLEFKDTFESLINKNSNIANVEKFHYLRSSLGGSVKQIIESLDISDANYVIAWETICKRFNNKRILIQNHISAIYDIQPIKVESSEGLRNMWDTVYKHLRALENLGRPVNTWDDLLIFHLAGRLDRVSLKEWEGVKVQKEIPTMEDFKDFIRGRADLLQGLEQSRTKSKDNFYGHQEVLHRKGMHRTFVSTERGCVLCKGSHDLGKCKQFLDLQIRDRVNVIKRHKLCMGCFSNNHFSRACKAPNCAKCGLSHHVLLHYSRGFGATPVHNPEARVQGSSKEGQQGLNNGAHQGTTNNNDGGNVMALSNGVKNVGVLSKQVLLSTAKIRVKDAWGNLLDGVVLLDSGSMSNFITKGFRERLGLKMEKVDISVIGINQECSAITERCSLEGISWQGDFRFSLSCLVIPKISDEVPSSKVDVSGFDIPRDISLANPQFDEPRDIDLLIGASAFWKILTSGRIEIGSGKPILQNTRLGWIASGDVIGEDIKGHIWCNLVTEQGVQEQLAKFWQFEEPGCSNEIFPEEAECEKMFNASTIRNLDGRFIVDIPFKESVEKLGDSRQMAFGRLLALERRLSRNECLRVSYCEYMKEYERVGHMTRVDGFNSIQKKSELAYYLPHHGVIKESSSTTKLRVVYDGSAPSDNGVSLNDLQFVGPKIQEDLFYILLRFRQHRVAICADIAKMYRQVWVNEEHRQLQRILWRYHPSDEVQVYNLNTVVFGLTSSPFLAVRCLKQLALENKDSYPEASQVLERDFYIDDWISGARSAQEASQLCKDLIKILSSGGFELRKFCSNNREFLEGIGQGRSVDQVLNLGEGEQTKTLGLFWDYGLDCFTYRVNRISDCQITKRKILSEVAQIFDPLGLVSACIIIPKIMLQQLWLLKLSWDDEVPDDIKKRWLYFREDLVNINSLAIPRYVSCVESATTVEVHGFSDASQNAIGACVYVRTVNESGTIQCNLLCAKSKVAPIKALTIPKLELSAALLLCKLVKEVYNSKILEVDKLSLWCDSQVVLCWIRSPANQFNQFVSNRVAQIQTLLGVGNWCYVRSEENPADMVSRGVFPSNLKNNDFWFHGPKWLSGPSENFPHQGEETLEFSELPEKRRNLNVLLVSERGSLEFELFKRVSSFITLKRVMAYVLRFIENKCKGGTLSGILSVSELKEAEKHLIKIAQQECLLGEIELIRKQKVIKRGKLASLNPFIDSDNILRVGGRLGLSDFSQDKKYPMVLGSKHVLSELIVKFEHDRLMHAGPQMVLSSLRERYWLLGGRNLVRKVVRGCVVCAKAKPRNFELQMGNLPRDRVAVQPAFNTVGVDYAGPFNLRIAQGRGHRLHKGYICLFVCFVTRAIYLEVVTSMSTDAFMAAFKRFVSRRGKPSKIYSDNGKNFVGAWSELRDFGSFLMSNQDKLKDLGVNEGVEWSFIPAYSPHFGGIWEAGVKTVKYHLKRVLGPVNLTYEDFSTVLCQVEAIVNSRPLTPMSASPSDLDVLTPGHFLIGRRLISLSEKCMLDVSESRLSRFQRLQQIQQKFWHRWSKEYIAEMQERVKWKFNKDKLSEGMLVLLKEDNTPPMCWKMGRVVRLHPGKDGINRVATVRTQNCEVKRSFAKLCPLPVDT